MVLTWIGSGKNEKERKRKGKERKGKGKERKGKAGVGMQKR